MNRKQRATIKPGNQNVIPSYTNAAGPDVEKTVHSILSKKKNIYKQMINQILILSAFDSTV